MFLEIGLIIHGTWESLTTSWKIFPILEFLFPVLFPYSRYGFHWGWIIMIHALLSKSILNQIEKGMELYSHASNVTSKLKYFVISDPSGVEPIKKRFCPKFFVTRWRQIIGKSWKTHPEILLKFSFSGSSNRSFYWKTHPFEFFDWKRSGWVFQ